MNKFLVIAAAIVAILAGIYVYKKDSASDINAYNNEPALIAPLESNPNISIAQTSGKIATVTSSQSKSSSSGEITTGTIAVEQTQNAVDFNAPGAGTAQQKAGAAAAANKAYQESKQQNH